SRDRIPDSINDSPTRLAVMRTLLLSSISVTILGLGILVGAQPQGASVKLRLRLVDAGTGHSVGGIVKVTDAEGKLVELPGLFDRMAGLTKDLPGVHWYVVPAGGVDIVMPRGKLTIHAVSGLETELAQQELD